MYPYIAAAGQLIYLIAAYGLTECLLTDMPLKGIRAKLHGLHDYLVSE